MKSLGRLSGAVTGGAVADALHTKECPAQEKAIVIEVPSVYRRLRDEAMRLRSPLRRPAGLIGGRETLLSAIEAGLAQIVGWKGLIPEMPFEGLGQTPFYEMMAMLGLRPVRHVLVPCGAASVIDVVEFEHEATAEMATLYNRVAVEDCLPGEN